MIEYIKGDLIKSDCDVIIHGCNCFGCMGAGIAKQIKETYPEAYKADLATVWGDKNKLGTYSSTRVERHLLHPVHIINAYTQFEYGRQHGKVYADYDAIKKVMIEIHGFFRDGFYNKWKIGMPKIGAGLARGDWNIIERIINNVFGKRIVHVYEWDHGEVKKEEFNMEQLRTAWKKQLDEKYKEK